VYKDEPFQALEDFKNAALDAIWVAVLGEEPGTIRYEIKKLQHQVAGAAGDFKEDPPGRLHQLHHRQEWR
jgi:hypothetical protein